jgi:hypothetical protein
MVVMYPLPATSAVYARARAYTSSMQSESRITFVSVGWTTDSGGVKVINLDAMRRHCRSERVEDLLEDLTMLCEDVEARRHPEAADRYLSLVPEP